MVIDIIGRKRNEQARKSNCSASGRRCVALPESAKIDIIMAFFFTQCQCSMILSGRWKLKGALKVPTPEARPSALRWQVERMVSGWTAQMQYPQHNVDGSDRRYYQIAVNSWSAGRLAPFRKNCQHCRRGTPSCVMKLRLMASVACDNDVCRSAG